MINYNYIYNNKFIIRGMRILIGQYNIGVAAINTTALTLTLTGLNGFDFDITNLARLYDTTTSTGSNLQGNVTNVINTIAPNGAQTTVYTFRAFPAGWANGDTYVVELNVPITIASYFTQVYQASKL